MEDLPVVITYRFPKKTSQGKVVMGKMIIDGVDFFLIVKANQITSSQKILWIGDKKMQKLITSKGNYQIISKSYMDGLCSIIMSRYVKYPVSLFNKPTRYDKYRVSLFNI